MSLLSNLQLEELLFLKELIENKELQEELNQLLEIKENQSMFPSEYQSNRLPEYYEQYKEQCSYLLSQLTADDVPFVPLCAYMDSGNNKGGWFCMQEKHAYYSAQNNIGYLEHFFDENDKNIYLYEGTYNTLNYLRTAICIALKDGKTIECKKDLMKDQEEKREIATKALSQIAKELLFLRESVPNSRLSITNQGLSRMAKKTSASLSRYQKLFIDAIAFGSNLENLKDGNYNEAKRLLFVPQSKR